MSRSTKRKIVPQIVMYQKRQRHSVMARPQELFCITGRGSCNKSHLHVLERLRCRCITIMFPPIIIIMCLLRSTIITEQRIRRMRHHTVIVGCTGITTVFWKHISCKKSSEAGSIAFLLQPFRFISFFLF